jgi:hypothetical protein
VFFSVLVPPPKQLTLERQLNKSVLIGWNPPDNTPSSAIDSYHLYVDGVLKATVKSTERTRALVEGVDSNRVSAMCRVCRLVLTKTIALFYYRTFFLIPPRRFLFIRNSATPLAAKGQLCFKDCLKEGL